MPVYQLESEESATLPVPLVREAAKLLIIEGARTAEVVGYRVEIDDQGGTLLRLPTDDEYPWVGPMHISSVGLPHPSQVIAAGPVAKLAQFLWIGLPNIVGATVEGAYSGSPTLRIDYRSVQRLIFSTYAPSSGPAAVSTHPEADELRAENERRIELIRKRTREGLSENEGAELRLLLEAVRSYVDAAHPLPTQFLRGMWQEVQQAASRLPEQTPEE
jgi:hypothetical protein